MLNDCGAAQHIDKPTTCDRACDILILSDCPEGTYHMCKKRNSNDCEAMIDAKCVMNVRNRKEIIKTCHVKCEW
jgi:hypothetical protein